MVYNRPLVISLPNLTTLRVSINDCRLFHAPRVSELSLLMTPLQLLRDRRAMALAVRHIASSLPNIQSLTILGDVRAEQFQEAIVAICRSCRKLRRLMVSPCILTVRLLRSISIMPTLEAIQVFEEDVRYERRSANSSKPVISDASLVLRRKAFPALRRIDLTASSANSAIHLFTSRNFPSRSLTSLWLRFAIGAQLSPHDVDVVFHTIAAHCTTLQSLTLRFAPFDEFGLDGVTGVPGIHFDQIESFLSLPCLNEFVFDHTLPLSLTMANIEDLARRATHYRVLWLNPYPAIIFMLENWKGAALTALSYFAEHCHALERLGLCLDATQTIDTGSPSSHFTSLRELFVGWSEIAHSNLTIGSHDMVCCESSAIFLSHILPDFTTISTPLDLPPPHSVWTSSSYTRSPHIYFEEEERKMESRRRAWIMVSAIAKFLRTQRHTTPDTPYFALSNHSPAT